MMRISLCPLMLFLLMVAISWSQSSVMPDTWLLTQKNSAGNYFLHEYFSGDIVLRAAPGENTSLINFNPVMPVSGLDSVLASLHYLPKTMISVVSSDFFNEQAIWSLSDAVGTLAVMTNKRIADLNRYQYMNFPQRSFPQPLLSTYIHGHEIPDSDTEYLLYLGNSGTGNLPVEQFTGHIAEVMLFDRVLSREERNVIESYLAIKYGLTLTAFQSPNYVDTQGNILWDGLFDKDYNYRISGIGRDDAIGLYQRQSTSSIDPGVLIISAGTCADDNAENGSSLPNGAFLLWGDNNAPMLLEELSGRKLLFQRQWKVSASNWPDSLSSTVIFDRSNINTFLNEHEMYWLAIDRDGRGKDTELSMEYFPAILTKDRILFQGIVWDTDHSAGDHFNLMIGPLMFSQVTVEQPSCGIDFSGSLHISTVGGTPPYKYSVFGPDGHCEQWTSADKSVRTIDNLGPGEYTIRLRDAGFLEYEDVQILAHSTIQSVEMDRQYFMPQAGTMQIDLSDLGFEELHWTFPTGQKVRGQSVVISSPGIYTILGKKQGCISAGTLEVKLLSGSLFYNFLVYPNPTSTGDFQVMADLERTGDLEISVNSAAGHLIEHRLLQGRTNFTYKSRITGSPGSYIITASAHGQSVSIPLIYR